MILDKRILPNKRPLTCLDVNEAREFKGKTCIFSDSYAEYKDIKDYTIRNPHNTGFLEIYDDPEYEDYVFRNSHSGFQYRLALPLEWVTEEKHEKTYRPFSIEEWKFKHSIGDTILYRYKGTYCGEHREVETVYLGYAKPLDRITDEPGKGELILGDGCHGLQNLCDNYEIWIDGEWKTFGVEVEE